MTLLQPEPVLTQQQINSFLQMMIEQIELSRQNNALLRDTLEAIKSMPRGGYNKPQHYDIVITTFAADTITPTDYPDGAGFELVFAPRYNPADKTLNFELKKTIQDGITSALAKNRDYKIVETAIVDKQTGQPKVSKAGKPLTEWHFIFSACHADAIGQRIEALAKNLADNKESSVELKVKNIEALAAMAQAHEQVAFGTSNQDPLIQQIHILGNEWAKLCNPEMGDWKSRHGAITRQYFNKDSTTELTPEQKEKYIRWLLRTMLREMGTQIWGSRFIGDLETQMIQVEYPDAENYQNLTTSQLRSLKTKWENQLGAKERRL